MFINCPFCHALVATNPATDEPPPNCPRCAAVLREAAPALPSLGDSGTDAVDAHPAAAEAVRLEVPPPDVPPPDAVPADVVPPDPVPRDVPEEAAPETAAAAAESADANPAHVATPAADLPGAQRAADLPAAHRTAADVATGGAARVPVLAALLRRGHAASAVPDRRLTPMPRAPASPVSPPIDPTADPGHAAAGLAAAAEILAPAEAAAPMRDAVAFPTSPSFAPGGARTVRPAGWLLPTVAVTLLLVLAMQWLLAERARLAADARWRPLVLQACSLLRCTVAPWHEASALVLLDRDVRAHPAIPGALRVTASFRNDARWAQRWPRVLLTLSDVDGRDVGARAFLPAEYLRGQPPAAGIGSGRTAVVRLDVVEPSPRVVAFAFDFR